MSALRAPSCAAVSAALEEPLAGTAPSGVTRCLLVPHTGAWAKEPLDSERLEIPREALEAALGAVPGSRLQLFVREPGSPFSDAVMIARTEGDARGLFRFPLAEMRDTGALTASLLEPEVGERVEGPLHLVCTHGRRDVCCARLGTALFLALRAEVGERVLRTTHLGGHRFAPVVLTLPEGLCFGRVEEREARALDEAARRGEAYDPERLRGVFPLTPPAQAALVEHLRSGGGLRDATVEVEGELVRVREASLSRVYRVKREALPPLRPLSCGAAPGETHRFEVTELSEG